MASKEGLVNLTGKFDNHNCSVMTRTGLKVKKELLDSSEVEVIEFKNEDIELFDVPIQNRMKAVNEFKTKKKMMDSSEIEVIKIKDEVTEFCEVQIKTKIKSSNEVKIKKKMMKMNEIFEFQNGIELIDQLDIPVNNEIQDDLEQGNLLKGIDRKTVRTLGFRRLHPLLTYVFFSVTHIF